MKLHEMADLLSGLASTFEPHTGTKLVSDLREVSNVLRSFPDQTVKSFFASVQNNKNNKTPVRTTAPSSGDQTQAVNKLVHDIKKIHEKPDEHSFDSIERLMPRIRKLKNASIKNLGDQIGCPISGNKGEMVSRIEDWLRNFVHAYHRAQFN